HVCVQAGGAPTGAGCLVGARMKPTTELTRANRTATPTKTAAAERRGRRRKSSRRSRSEKSPNSPSKGAGEREAVVRLLAKGTSAMCRKCDLSAGRHGPATQSVARG